jgi:DegV family protein with EDD domain
MSVKIVTDSAADLPPGEAERYDIRVVPQLIGFPDVELRSTDIAPDAFYDRLQAMAPRIPTTSQPAPGAFADVFARLARDHHDIFAIHISSGLSGTIQSSRLAAAQFTGTQVTTVDSLTLSGGQRFQVLAAAAALRSGWATAQILDLLHRIQEQCEVIFTLDTLEYLARGGRIGRVEAVAGTLLHVKPVIHVHKGDGKYSAVGKVRTLQRAEATIVDHLVQMYGDVPVWVSVMHGRFGEHAEALKSVLQQRLNCVRSEILRISPVLGVHTGPGVVGAAVMPVSLLNGLDV